MRAIVLAAASLLAMVATAAAEEIKVEVVDGATVVRNVYVALYAPDDPWRRPSAEIVARDGKATFSLAAGSYILFAGADGYETGERTVDVPPGGGRTELVLRRASLTRSGTVHDASGRSIAGARVSLVRVPLSELAQGQLADGWSTMTDAKGKWTLPVPSAHQLPLLIEAPGFAAARHLSKPSEAAMPLDVVLAPEAIGADAVRASGPPPGGEANPLFLPHRSARDFAAAEAWRRNGERAPATTEPASGGTLLHVHPDTEFVTTENELIVATDIPRPRSILAIAHPRGEARLRLLSATEGVSLSRSGTATFGGCPQERRVVLPLTIGEDGAVTFPAPADCRSVVLSLPPLESAVMPLQIAKRESKWLGELRLRAGAAAEVRVQWDPSGGAAAGAMVRVLLETDDSRVVVAEGKADEEGRLRLAGLPVERDLTIEARMERGSTVGVHTVRVAPGASVAVEPLLLPEPASLTMSPRLSASFRELQPAATISAVNLDLVRRSGPGVTRSDSLGEDGTVMFSDLPPGRWVLRTIVDTGETGQPMDAGEVELAPGEHRTIEPEVEPLLFRGRLIAEDDVRGWSVAIGDPPGRNAIIRRLWLRPDRTFLAMLPRTGSYRVSVHSANPADSDIVIGNVDFSDSSREIEIVLPRASLRAVVRKDGRPVARAAVTVTLRNDPGSSFAGAPRQGESDVEGEARFANVAPGRWLVRATTGDGSAAQRLAVVASDSEARVELSLEAPGEVRGTVRRATGEPEPGAVVDCLSMSAAGPSSQRTRTDRDGRFALTMTDLPPIVRCSAVARGGMAGAFVLRPSASMELVLSPTGAAVHLVETGDRLPDPNLWLLAADGRVLQVAALATAARTPILPPGSWKLVRTRRFEEWVTVANGMTGNAEVIQEVRLTPGQVTEIGIHP